jgi:phosphoglycerate dehydrogenase-like enzyme
VSKGTFKVGITRDALRADGQPVFDPAALKIFDAEPNLKWEFLPELGKELTAAHGAGYDGLCVLGARVTADTLAGGRVAIIARHGVGYDSVDVPACTANGVLLTITPDGVRRPVATSILTLILALSHKLFTKDRLTRTGRWKETTSHMGEGLTGKVLGSIGMGNIGREMFRMVAPLEMVHIAYDPLASEDQARSLNVRLTDFDSVLRTADFVAINCPLSEQTRHLIDARALGLMKGSAYLINTARGPIVDEAALYAALIEKRIAGAALDVFEQEPTPDDNPILKLDNVITTPHSLCWTDECFRLIAEGAFRSVVAVARGELPVNVVNREVLNQDRLKQRLAAYRAARSS